MKRVARLMLVKALRWLDPPPSAPPVAACAICDQPLAPRNNVAQHRWTVCARPACKTAAKAVERARHHALVIGLLLFLSPVGTFVCDPDQRATCASGPPGWVGYITTRRTLADWAHPATFLTVQPDRAPTGAPSGHSYRCTVPEPGGPVWTCR